MKLNTAFTKIVAVILSVGLLIPNPVYAVEKEAAANTARRRQDPTWGGLVPDLIGKLGPAGLGAGLVPAHARSEARVSMTRVASEILRLLNEGKVDQAIRAFTTARVNKEIGDDEISVIEQRIFEQYKGPIAIVGKLGGTSMAFEAATPFGLLGFRVSIPTLESPEDSEAVIVQRIAEAIQQVIDRYGADRVIHVSFSAPGFFNEEGALTQNEPNIPGLKTGFHFGRAVGQALNAIYKRSAEFGDIPVMVGHDGTYGALGETSAFGTFEGSQDFLFVIAGTGIGTRRLLNGEPFTGGSRVNHLQNEAPHHLQWNGDEKNPDYEYIVLKTKGFHPDYLPGEMDLEDRTTGPALALFFRQISGEVGGGIVRGYPMSLADMQTGVKEVIAQAGGKLENVTAKEIGIAANRGNVVAKFVVESRARELGIGLARLQIESAKIWPEYTLPPHIVIGSGVAQIGSLFLEAVRQGARATFEKAGVKYDVSRIVLSGILDDTAREFFGGMPTAEQVQTHQEKMLRKIARRAEVRVEREPAKAAGINSRSAKETVTKGTATSTDAEQAPVDMSAMKAGPRRSESRKTAVSVDPQALLLEALRELQENPDSSVRVQGDKKDLSPVLESGKRNGPTVKLVKSADGAIVFDITTAPATYFLSYVFGKDITKFNDAFSVDNYDGSYKFEGTSPLRALIITPEGDLGALLTDEAFRSHEFIKGVFYSERHPPEGGQFRILARIEPGIGIARSEARAKERTANAPDYKEFGRFTMPAAAERSESRDDASPELGVSGLQVETGRISDIPGTGTLDWKSVLGNTPLVPANSSVVRRTFTNSVQEPLVVSADFAFGETAGLPLLPGIAGGNLAVVIAENPAQEQMVNAFNAQLPAGVTRLLVAQGLDEAMKALKGAIAARVRRGTMREGVKIRAIATPSTVDLLTLKHAIGDKWVFIATQGWVQQIAASAGLTAVVQSFAEMLAVRKSA